MGGVDRAHGLQEAERLAGPMTWPLRFFAGTRMLAPLPLDSLGRSRSSWSRSSPFRDRRDIGDLRVDGSRDDFEVRADGATVASESRYAERAVVVAPRSTPMPSLPGVRPIGLVCVESQITFGSVGGIAALAVMPAMYDPTWAGSTAGA